MASLQRLDIGNRLLLQRLPILFGQQFALRLIAVQKDLLPTLIHDDRLGVGSHTMRCSDLTRTEVLEHHGGSIAEYVNIGPAYHCLVLVFFQCQ